MPNAKHSSSHQRTPRAASWGILALLSLAPSQVATREELPLTVQ